MNFTNPSIRLSGRTMDLGSTTNWTITAWPAGEQYSSSDFIHEDFVSDEKYASSFHWTSLYHTLGITGNWFGDSHYGFPSLFGDGINEKGLSCGLLTLVDTIYEQPLPNKKNIFYGTFCQWALQNYANVNEVYEVMDDIRIWGPVILAEHFILRDANGNSLVIEMMNGKKEVYLDENDGKSGWGIMTNEPTFDWHLTNIGHYEWKRSLSRQAVAVPGGWYPEDRFLRLHMVKSGMQQYGLFDTADFQTAFALTAQVSYLTSSSILSLTISRPSILSLCPWESNTAQIQGITLVKAPYLTTPTGESFVTIITLLSTGEMHSTQPSAL